MRILATFIPENIINALGWTIFHSLWQGLIIGLIVFFIFKYHRNISSQTRYLLGVFALAAIFASSLFTFFIAYHPVSSQAEFVIFSSANISHLAGISVTADELSVLIPVSSGWQQSLIRTFDFVSIIWFIGVLLLTLRLAGGILVINGMRRQGVSPLPAAWEQRMQLLALKTGLRRSITYLQSQKVRVPTVIGILRPVVLIPAMIISGLPADQLETIIVHELAHIRRHDFLINIMQSIMEALFFYHPVVWIISENIRQEREKCCDDYTVRVCGQVSLYARALAYLSELQITAVIPSVAITGNKKNILNRVERLLNNNKMKTNTTE
ncbi:MAG: M56 family metallopeptidase, partial [Bacteroidales bacterium]|nr:M56 family metallopeptidase [Bacteroidales bacterium]